MFNKDFYPTPDDVIELMIGHTDVAGKIILEPSAGSGNIIDRLEDLGATTMACEKDEKLKIIAKRKASRWVKDDFLTVTREDVSHIDAIIMNPPFSNGDEHILHAWDVAPDGCEIIALCNLETLENFYTRRRNQLVKKIKDYGFYENLGPVFGESERTTQVNVALVKLFKPSQDGTFEDYFDYTPDEVEEQAAGIMSYNAVREVVNRYVAACKLYDQVADNAIQMNELVGIFGIGDLAFTMESKEKDVTLQNFKLELQKKCWKWIFSKMNMEKYMTANLKEELNKFVEKQQKVPFTMKNIYRMIDMVIATHGQRMDRVCLEVFERLTSHYHENRWELEGWKTNGHCLVNRKFILPYVFTFGGLWGNGNYLSIKHDNRNADLFEDFVKALDWITGERKFEELRRGDQGNYFSFREWAEGVQMPTNTWVDCTYFEIKGFKKGTLHAKFKNEKVWGLFNRKIAEMKGFELPEKV